MASLQFITFFAFLIISSAFRFQEPAEFQLITEELPADMNFMPTLGNGHLGLTVFGNAIFMNGIYNGQGGNSRRARLPNWLNMSVRSVTTDDGEQLLTTTTSYALDMKDGYFLWQHCNQELNVQQRIYAHRYYNRALIYELTVQRLNATGHLYGRLQRSTGDAFVMAPVTPTNDGFHMMRATTSTIEEPHFQRESKTIFMALSDDWTVEKDFVLAAGEREFYYRFVLTVDEVEEVARREMQEVLSLTPSKLRHTHADEWHKFWSTFGIEVHGSNYQTQTILAGIFYLASSLPSPRTFQPKSDFYGLSPTGLGRGQLDNDYEGHNFWDTEIWMFPVVAQLSPRWAEELLQYRMRKLPAAQYNARLTGYKGARFPWESAYTGTEVTNPDYPLIAAQQVHISADIVFAVERHYAATQNRSWLCADAWPLVREIATFLESRVEYSNETQHYHIKNVIGPDEDHVNVTDNVYTNVVFKLAFQFAHFTHQQCETYSEPSSNRLRIAEKLNILYNATLDYHPQHEGYEWGDQIKQADTILLGYPLQYAMNTTTRLHDLNAYGKVTRPTGPAMTWSMFAINYLDIGENDKANEYFLKSYLDYIQPEFRVWSEMPGGKGAVNFLTGVGGFLQAIIYGYAGARYRQMGESSFMEIKGGSLLPTAINRKHTFELRGLKFAESRFNLFKKDGHSQLKCKKIGSIALEAVVGTEAQPLTKGKLIVFMSNETLIIRRPPFLN